LVGCQKATEGKQPPQTTYYDNFYITATSDDNGAITPSGKKHFGGTEAGTVTYNQTYTWTPKDTSFHANTLVVDNVPQSIVGNSYTFTNIKRDHDIKVTFTDSLTSAQLDARKSLITADKWYYIACDGKHITSDSWTSVPLPECHKLYYDTYFVDGTFTQTSGSPSCSADIAPNTVFNTDTWSLSYNGKYIIIPGSTKPTYLEILSLSSTGMIVLHTADGVMNKYTLRHTPLSD
jgi:hypothetical protein